MKSSPLHRKTVLKPTATLKRTTRLKAKRSTGAPTKAQAKRMQAIQQCGCVVCMFYFGITNPPDIHHLTVGGKHGQKRRGHSFTIGLCCWHHRGVKLQSTFDYRSRLGPSYAEEPKTFREHFGNDDTLLRIQNEYVAQVLTC